MFMHLALHSGPSAGGQLKKSDKSTVSPGAVMSEHVYKTIEIAGSSTKSIEGAVETALQRADESLHSLRWFEVDNIRGHLEDGKIRHWQVTVKVGLTMD
jgi:dodecin